MKAKSFSRLKQVRVLIAYQYPLQLGMYNHLLGGSPLIKKVHSVLAADMIPLLMKGIYDVLVTDVCGKLMQQEAMKDNKDFAPVRVVAISHVTDKRPDCKLCKHPCEAHVTTAASAKELIYTLRSEGREIY